MADESVSARATLNASPEAIFAVLADPATHAAIDGTGWVCEPADLERLTASGQIFRMRMFHAYHPDGNYQVANRVQIFDPPMAISWEPGSEDDNGVLSFGGWIWRYDLTSAEVSKTEVILSYDWSAVPNELRQHIVFPPFPPDHLSNSLAHLADLVS
jgi:hypothetical protein